MGEEFRTYRWGAGPTENQQRLTVHDAARRLGISEDAVRMRVKRGKLSADKEGGRLYVLLDIEPTTEPTSDRTDELIEELKDRVHRLEYQLDQEREARTEERRRQDTVIAQLSRANEEQARTIRQLEAPSEARESDVSPAPTDEWGEIREELGAEQARRKMAESTLREGMAEEQRRREEAERERDDLRRELFGLREPRESPQTVDEEPERAEARPATGGAQEGVQKPWWRRVFGR
jgi:hypothetical protein